MTTLTAGQSFNSKLNAGNYLLITKATGSDGNFSAISNGITIDQNSFGITPALSGKQFGTYSVDANLTINCTTGSLDYAIVAPQSRLPNVSLPIGNLPLANGGTGSTAGGLNQNPASNYGCIPNVLNFSPATTLVKWRKALARVRANVANARVLLIGDSTTFGVGSNGSLTTGNLKAGSYGRYLSDRLNAFGVNSNWDAFFGYGAASAGAPNNASNDSRIVLSGSMGFISNDSCPGGAMFEANAAGNMAFTPVKQWDTAISWGINLLSGSGSITHDINGAGASIISQAGSQVVVTYTKSTTLGLNVYNYGWSSGGKIFLIGVETFNSAQKSVNIINAGYSGSTSGNWNNTLAPWTPLSFLQNASAAPDLTIINLGINDWEASSNSAAYLANMQAIITAAKASGDVILLSPNPSEPTTASAARQLDYVNQLYALAASNGVLLIDNFSRWVSYAVSNVSPTMYGDVGTDAKHPREIGYSDIAESVFKVIASP